jgi:hypothetical protein
MFAMSPELASALAAAAAAAAPAAVVVVDVVNEKEDEDDDGGDDCTDDDDDDGCGFLDLDFPVPVAVETLPRTPVNPSNEASSPAISDT